MRLLLLLLRHLLVVLVIGDVILVATVGGIRVRAIVLSVLRTVISRATRSPCWGGRALSGWARCGWRMLLISSVAAVRVTVSALAVAAVVMLRRVLLETLILLPDVGQQVLTELLGVLDLIGVRTTALFSDVSSETGKGY